MDVYEELIRERDAGRNCALAVIVSEHNPTETLNQQSGVDHARVIGDCFQHSTVLPFRFGTVFNDAAIPYKFSHGARQVLQLADHFPRGRGLDESATLAESSPSLDGPKEDAR